jgi:hypothetical protein
VPWPAAAPPLVWRKPAAFFVPLAVAVAMLAPLFTLGLDHFGLLVCGTAAVGVAGAMAWVAADVAAGALFSRGAVVARFALVGAALGVLVPLGLGGLLGISLLGESGTLAQVGTVFLGFTVIGSAVGLALGVPLAALAGLAVAVIALARRRDQAGGSVGP